MKTYHSDGFRSIRQSDAVRSAEDAARVFAGRQARREYGRTGHVRTLRADSWTRDGSSATFEAFIGRPGSGIDRNTTVGRNVWLHVDIREGSSRRLRGGFAANRPGDAAAIYAAETGVSYAEALVATNTD